MRFAKAGMFRSLHKNTNVPYNVQMYESFFQTLNSYLEFAYFQVAREPYRNLNSACVNSRENWIRSKGATRIPARRCASRTGALKVGLIAHSVFCIKDGVQVFMQNLLRTVYM